MLMTVETIVKKKTVTKNENLSGENLKSCENKSIHLLRGIC